MLRSLHIKNFALIEDVSIEFEPGLTVITGETGTGKNRWCIDYSQKVDPGQEADCLYQ